MALINSYLYLYHLDKFVVLPDYPESITDSLPSKFQDTNALARTAPVWSYIQSGPRGINSISLELHRDMMENLNRDISNLKDNVVDLNGDDYVDTLIKYLQAATLPKYNEYSSGSKTVIPPMVALRFGNDIFIKGVVNGAVQITYKKPILNNNKYAVVNIGFQVYETDPYDAETVLQQGSFRGFTRAFKDGIYADSPSSPTLNETAVSATNTRVTEKPASINSKNNVPVTPKKKKDVTTTSKRFRVTNTSAR